MTVARVLKACSSCGAPLVELACEACQLEHVVIAPHPGPQSQFLASKATVVVYGGAAGGGKTWALLIDALARAIQTNEWAGLIVRSKRVLMEKGGGAIWAEAKRVLKPSGPEYNESKLEVRWLDTSSVLTFAQILDNEELWNGPSYDWIAIEELQEVEVDTLISALTRLRSAKGAGTRLAATCNPKRGHGLVPWIEWYLLPDGTPDPERSGVVRWFCRSTKTDLFIFADTPEEAERLAGGEPGEAMSFTYIAANVDDNPTLLGADPGYKARLRAQGRVKAAQLLGGSWYAGGDDDGPLARDRWEFVTAPLAPIVKWIRPWDKASTRPWPGTPDPDYTAGPLLGFDAAGRMYFAGLAACREDPPARDMMISATAALDGHMVAQVHKTAPGDAGKDAALHTGRLLAAAGGQVSTVRERAAKHGVERIGALALGLELGMQDGKPVSPAHPADPAKPVEPRFFVLDGPAQPGWPASYRQGWLLAPYSDGGTPPPPRTLGELAWSQLDPWPRAAHDDIPDAMADGYNRGAAGPGRQLKPRDRARATVRRA